MDDLIRRQDAYKVLTDYYHHKTEIQHMGLKEALNRVPYAQPEIIRCKDCQYHHYENGRIPYCSIIDYGYGWKDDDFCSRAERRTDEVHHRYTR